MTKIITSIVINSILTAVMIGPAIADPSKTLVIDSKPIHIDRVFPSMAGPEGTNDDILEDRPTRNVFWLTEIKIDVTKDGVEGDQDQYLCHANLDISNWSLQSKRRESRLIDLVQGQSSIKLPEGFGIPVFSPEKLKFYSMMFNTQPVETPFDLTYQATLTYQEQTDTKLPLKALMRRVIAVTVPVEQETEGHAGHDGPPQNINASKNADHWTSEEGEKMTYHWYVPPGRHLYTQQLGRRREVRVHFIGSHLHPYGEYVEIKDVTDNKVIFRSEATPLKGQPGIAELSAFSSIKGVTLHNDHDYAITTQYNNTTDHPIDAMAILYLYFHNKRLEDQIKQLFKS